MAGGQSHRANVDREANIRYVRLEKVFEVRSGDKPLTHSLCINLMYILYLILHRK